MLRRSFPSFLTSVAILAGCISIVYSTRDNLTMAAWLVLVAALLDFLDGFAARSLNAITAFGKQLDSLADVVNFGVAPSLIMFHMITRALVHADPQSAFDFEMAGTAELLVLYSSFLLVVFSALRLARFNISPSNNNNFTGLPTPASALLVVSLGILSESGTQGFLQPLVHNVWFLCTINIIVSALMVSSLPMLTLKFTSAALRPNAMRYLLLLLSAGMIVVYGLGGIFYAILFYILLSVIRSFFPKVLS